MLVVKRIGANKTEIRTGEAVVLVSYETPVAAIVNGRRVRTATKWSPTTERHITKWINGYPCEVVPQDFFQTVV